MITTDPKEACSPRTWRSSDDRVLGQEVGQLLSTHVEVFRPQRAPAAAAVTALHARGGLPAPCPSCTCGSPALHARGGLPSGRPSSPSTTSCSPHMWRSTVVEGHLVGVDALLSTHVEILREVG